MNPFMPKDTVPLATGPDGLKPGMGFAGERQAEGP
jgi:hypothetical protein